MFVKLFSSITESSLWSESKDARLLFVTMLAKADWDGFVDASLPGLARVANLTMQETEQALVCLCGPDPHSKNPAHEGRRVEKVVGGWMILNYAAYREVRSQEERRAQNREAQRRHRQQRSASVSNGQHSQPRSAHSDTDTDLDTSSAASFVVPENADAAAAALPGAGADHQAAPHRQHQAAPPPADQRQAGKAPPLRGCSPTAAVPGQVVPQGGSPEQARVSPPLPADGDLFGTDKCQPAPPAPARPPLLAAATLADWRFMLPALLVSEQEDVELARRLVRLYGHHAAKHLATLQALAATRPKGKQRVFVKELQEWLAARLEPDREDYERAGILPPADMKNTSPS